MNSPVFHRCVVALISTPNRCHSTLCLLPEKIPQSSIHTQKTCWKILKCLIKQIHVQRNRNHLDSGFDSAERFAIEFACDETGIIPTNHGVHAIL